MTASPQQASRAPTRTTGDLGRRIESNETTRVAISEVGLPFLPDVVVSLICVVGMCVRRSGRGAYSTANQGLCVVCNITLYFKKKPQGSRGSHPGITMAMVKTSAPLRGSEKGTSTRLKPVSGEGLTPASMRTTSLTSRTGASNGDKPVMYVGARNARPSTSSPLARWDSQATLVGSPSPSPQPTLPLVCHDTDTDIEDESANDVPIHKRSPTCSRTRRQRHIAPLEDYDAHPRVRSHCPEDRVLPRVSVIDHPKPKAPVADHYMVTCSKSPAGHDWHVTANGSARRYLCFCGYQVREKKENGFWAPDSVSISAVRESWGTSTESDAPGEGAPLSPPGPRTRSQTRGMRSSHPPSGGARPLSTIQSAAEEDCPANVDGGVDSDVSMMSDYESAVEELSPSPRITSIPRIQPEAPRRSSAGTTNSDAPSSLAGLPYLRRLPGRPGSDVSSPIGRLRQVSSRRVSNSTAETRSPPTAAPVVVETSPAVSVPEVAPEDWPLVSKDPKPVRPVASAVPRCEVGPDHAWRLWGNMFARHYTCKLCSLVVKERKYGSPEVWVPMHYP